MEEPDTTKEERRSFTSWKMDVIDALSCDGELKPPIDRLVAIRILQHVNRETKTANVSMVRIAAQLNVSVDTVKRSVARLAKKHNWLDRARLSRLSEYTYRFNDRKISGILDAKLLREEAAASAMKDRKERLFESAAMPPREDQRGGKTIRDEVANSYESEVAEMPPKHLRDNYLQEHLQSQGSEGSDSNAYARAKGKAYAA